MPIYDKNGTSLLSAYDKNGSALTQAYDKDGNPLLAPVSTSLVVMSYNIQWFDGMNSNTAMQEEILAVYDADIIGFQEFQYASSSIIPSKAITLLSGSYSYLQMCNYGNKVASASKCPLVDYTTVPFSVQTDDGKSYTTATITVDGKEILIVNAHLTTSNYETAKVQQASEVFAALQGHEYFILTGDFNTVCKSVNDAEYITIMKQFVDAGYNCANCTSQHGFLNTWTSGSTESGTWYPCDHIITSANISIDSVTVDERKIAVAAETGQSIDHLPIIAELTIN